MVLSLLIGAVQGIVGGVEKLDELNKELNSAAKGSNNNSKSKDKTCPHCGASVKEYLLQCPYCNYNFIKGKVVPRKAKSHRNKYSPTSKSSTSHSYESNRSNYVDDDLNYDYSEERGYYDSDYFD